MNAAKPRKPSSHAVRRSSFFGLPGRKERNSGRTTSMLQRVARIGLQDGVFNLTSSSAPWSSGPSSFVGIFATELGRVSATVCAQMIVGL